ncbi:MAG: glucose-6-phosphate isomerase [Firmicutes bacterium]|nr:glucose-6-phosphate isomerase [Bacillota bacterium]
MYLTLDYNNMMSEFVGKHGVTPEDIAALSDQIGTAGEDMAQKRENGGMDWRELPYNQGGTVAEIQKYTNEMKDRAEAFVVLGIGGSALGPMAVQQALNHPFYNELPKEKRGGFPKLYVADNVDPERLTGLFDAVDPAKCIFNVISKSGSTSETMSQFMIIKALLEERLGAEAARERIVCTTDAEKGLLVKIARGEGYRTFYIPSGVGGRFSELCPVGLLPAAFCGIDIEGLLRGAAEADKICSVPDAYKNPAYMFAVLNYIAMKKGLNIVVMMPYADSLKYFADWFAQLWAESLGKKFDFDGNEVYAGTTPVKALGVTDQHSMVQLYAEGRWDKIVVFIGVEKFRRTIEIPRLYADMPSLGFLGGVTHNRLIRTEMAATEYALLKAGKPNMTITLPEVSAETVGRLIYFFEVATAFAGELMRINAFDQPGVEEGKNATYAMFGRPGYEEKRREMEARPGKSGRYII